MARKFWTISEEDYLRAQYPDNATRSVARALGRSQYSVYQHANIMGLKKSAAHMTSINSGKFTGEEGKQYRYKKGQKPWNDGIKYSPIGCRKSQFRKGHKPIQTGYDGEIRQRNDGGRLYKWIRISNRVWIPLHVKIWMDVNGPVPDGFIVVFKNTTIPDRENIENLELISRLQTMFLMPGKWSNNLRKALLKQSRHNMTPYLIRLPWLKNQSVSESRISNWQNTT